jgi:hypothetical protein
MERRSRNQKKFYHEGHETHEVYSQKKSQPFVAFVIFVVRMSLSIDLFLSAAGQIIRPALRL